MHSNDAHIIYYSNIVRGHPFPTPHIQLRSWLCNSDSICTTPTVATQLRLRRRNSLRLPPPRHPPHYTHLPTYYTVLSHAHMAYIVVTPSRVFLRVFSLDFPLLGQYFTLLCIIATYIIHFGFPPASLSDFLSITGLPLHPPDSLSSPLTS